MINRSVLRIALTLAAITVSAPAPHALAATPRPDPEVVALAKLQHLTNAQAQRWLTSQDRAQALAPEFDRLLGAQFGGIWMDTGHPGTIKVATTGAARAVADVAVELGVGPLVSPVHTTVSLRALKAVQTDVVATLRPVQRASGFTVAVVPQRQATVLSLGPHARSLGAVQDVVTTLRARHGTRLIVASLAGEPAPDTCSGAYCNPPLRGGVQINPAVGGPCTAGFMARRGAARFVLTAGHCTAAGGTWTTRYADASSHIIGPVADTWFPTGDAGAIKVTNAAAWSPKPWVFKRPPTAVWETYPVKAVALPIPLGFVCHTGAATGTSCGLVLDTGTFVSYSSGNSVFGVFTVGGWCTKPGDSGGPTYILKQAIGLHSGSLQSQDPCNIASYEYPVVSALLILNLELVLAP